MSEANKNDSGKDPWHLAPWDAFRAIVSVLRYGAHKYAPRDWEAGTNWSRYFSALQRHLAAWWQGETADPESGMSHLWHAGCCVAFLIAYELRGVGTDDRQKQSSQSFRDMMTRQSEQSFQDKVSDQRSASAGYSK